MQGRVLLFQLHPSECTTNYAGAAACRFNLDVQNLHRVSNPQAWLEEDEPFPHVGAQPNLGYMRSYEVGAGEVYVQRPALPDAPLAWEDDVSNEQWRDILLQCLASTEDTEDADSQDTAAANKAFADEL